MHFETRAIHDGQAPDPATGAITTPIYQTSTYVQDAVGVNKGYDYARVANPTRTALQECLASLEGAAHGRAFSSGLGGVTTLMHLLSPGDHVVAVNDVYGGIYRMFTQVYEPKGYRFTFLSPEQISTELAEHLDERTKFVWLETPTNPALNIVDIAAASEIAHGVGATVVVDNTFATPYSVVRHPIYSGGILVFTGISLALSPWALAGTAALAVLWALKARVEERFLAATYPGYEDYSTHVRYRLVPFVY
jgi:cystathionine beta-lyase/cystathionine gamma-synthase